MECTIHTPECSLDEEVIVLEAIYINEITVERGIDGHVTEIGLLLHPATADETDRQFVKITLVIRLSLDYPNQLPEIKIENSRGLSDNQIKCLSETLNLHAQDKRGWPMLHELIETAKDTLTAGNLPNCPCAICLDHFTEDDDIHKTICYHYYHQDCLMEYVDYYRSTVEEASNDKTIHCPICREEIEVDSQVNVKKKVETKESGEYVPDAYVKALQDKMQRLYMKQKENGGIIDVDAEKNKFLVLNGTVVVPREFVQDTEERLDELMQQSQQNAESSQNSSGQISEKSRSDNWKQTYGRGGRRQPRDYRPNSDTRRKQREDADERRLDSGGGMGSGTRNRNIRYDKNKSGGSELGVTSSDRPTNYRMRSDNFRHQRPTRDRAQDESYRNSVMNDSQTVRKVTRNTNCDKPNTYTSASLKPGVNTEARKSSKERLQSRQPKQHKVEQIPSLEDAPRRVEKMNGCAPQPSDFARPAPPPGFKELPADGGFRTNITPHGATNAPPGFQTRQKTGRGRAYHSIHHSNPTDIVSSPVPHDYTRGRASRRRGRRPIHDSEVPTTSGTS